MVQIHDGRVLLDNGHDARGRGYRLFDYAKCGGYAYSGERFRYVIYCDGVMHYVTDDLWAAVDELDLCTVCAGGTL